MIRILRHRWIRIVARLLRLANASKGGCGQRESFYAMKERILRRYGRLVGTDVQEIVKKCFACDGAGYHLDEDDRCRRCDGTGEYEHFWVVLERWQIAGHVFHRPVTRKWVDLGGRHPFTAGEVTIHGYIEHVRVGHAGSEAALWLSLVFDRPSFRGAMRGAMHCCGWYWYPLCNLQRTIFVARSFVKAFQRCGRCGRWLYNRRSIVYVCDRCTGLRGFPFNEEAPF